MTQLDLRLLAVLPDSVLCAVNNLVYLAIKSCQITVAFTIKRCYINKVSCCFSLTSEVHGSIHNTCIKGEGSDAQLSAKGENDVL